jgi:hypothetical protein
MTTTADWTPLRDLLILLAQGGLARNVYVGGSEVTGIVSEATGDKVLIDYVPLAIDNTDNRITGFDDDNGGTLTVQVRMFLRVSNTAINITPKVWYGTTMGAITTVATISGTAACAATNSDYSGSNQIQTFTVTLPSGARYLKVGFTIAGTPASGYQAWARAYADYYVAV